MLGSFVGREAVVDGAAEGRLFPGVFRYGDDLAFGERGDGGGGVRHLGDAEVGWPAVVLVVPARVDVVQLVGVLKVRSIDCELIVRLEFVVVAVLGGPGVLAFAHDGEHAVVDGGAVVLAPHLHLGWWRVEVGVCGEDYPPASVDLVDFGRPEVGGVRLVGLGDEDGLGLCGVPGGHGLAAPEGDVDVVGVGHVVVVLVAEHPAKRCLDGY